MPDFKFKFQSCGLQYFYRGFYVINIGFYPVYADDLHAALDHFAFSARIAFVRPEYVLIVINLKKF